MSSNMRTLAGLIFVACLATLCSANKKTLVLLDNWTIRETHSIFFKSLRGEHSIANASVVSARGLIC